MRYPASKHINRTLLLLIVALVGIGSGIIYKRLQHTDTTDLNTHSENPVPKSMQELVAGTDLIIIGRVDHIEYQGTFYGYDNGAPSRAKMEKASPTPLGLPITDYEIDVEQVLKDDGAVIGGHPVILRLVESPYAKASLALPQIGDRRLFFLGQNPDKSTYGLASLMHQIDINKPVAVYYRGNSPLVPFGMELDPESFIEATEKFVARNTLTPERR